MLSLFARFASRQDSFSAKVVAALEFGGHAVKKA
jgi:6-phosphogluconate dehydrogenase (decarboxylating)